eukprot:scaffold609_cov130-Cylindrotheca_fusiformis.AAC.15
MDKAEEIFDVCIIGGGPAGLATLSGIHSRFTIDGSTMTPVQQERVWKNIRSSNSGRNGTTAATSKKQHKVCVVDSGSFWLEQWQKNFASLSIQHLRSPVLAHPDLFDAYALLSYAVKHGREDELLESGCGDVKDLLALGQSQIGLWKLPSTRLFVDFCLDLANSLSHTFLPNSVVLDISQKENHHHPQSNQTSYFQVTLENSNNSAGSSSSKQVRVVTAKAVVLAVGTVGRPIVPTFLPKYNKNKNNPSSTTWRFWNQPETVSDNNDRRIPEYPVLVLGGGLTAVQIALNEVSKRQCRRRQNCPAGQKKKQGEGNKSLPPPPHGMTTNTTTNTTCCDVILVSKRPLMEKHFDIPMDWFDTRKANKCMADFYHHPMEDRKRALVDARQGGSIPPMYLRQLQEAIDAGHVQCHVGVVEEFNHDSDQNHPFIDGDDDNHHSPNDAFQIQTRSTVADESSTTTTTTTWIDHTVVACGVEPCCEASPLIEKLQSQWPIRVEGGLPCVTQDLRWTEGIDLFVVGSLGALNIGPDAGNLMGIRRAAQLVANALGCRRWLRETVYANPFEVFWSDSSSLSSSDEDEDSDDDALSCLSQSSKKKSTVDYYGTDSDSLSDCPTCA